MHLLYPPGNVSFGVAFGHIRDEASKYVNTSVVQKSGMGTKISYPVGYDIPTRSAATRSPTQSLFRTIPG